MEFIKRSALSGEKYDVFDKDILHIVNVYQAAYYVEFGIPILDVQLSSDRKTGKPMLVFLFRRSATKSAFDAWCKQKEGGDSNDENIGD